MARNDNQIRELIERWAKAVRAEDMDGVVADHTPDMLMFDVPPPNAVEGIGPYRETWPPFYDAFRGSGVFEIVRLDVTAGDRAAFATAAALRNKGRAGEEARPAPAPDGGTAQGRRPLNDRARASFVSGEVSRIPPEVLRQ